MSGGVQHIWTEGTLTCSRCGSQPRTIDEVDGVCPADVPPAEHDALRDGLRIHHPIMRSETGPLSGCRCGQVRLGQDVIAHVVTELRAALDGGQRP